jgi:hypothetical protein
MDTEKEFKKIKAQIDKWHKKEKGWWFPDKTSEGQKKQSHDKDLQELK